MRARLTATLLAIPLFYGLTAIAVQARQSQWWYVSQGADRVLFIDEKSIERDGDIARYATSQVFGPDSEMLTQRAFMKTDCARHTQQWILVMRYGQTDQPLDQTALAYDDIQTIEPNTLGEAELNFVCASDRTGTGGFPIALDDVALAHALIANDDPSFTPTDIYDRLKANPATPIIRSRAPSPATFGTDQAASKGQAIVPPRDYASGIEPPAPLDYDADESGRIYDIAYQGIEKGEIVFELRGYAINDLARPGSGQTIRTPVQAKREQIGDLSITIVEATPERLRYRVERKPAQEGVFPIADR